nr:hypothetical protein Iba_chr06aCG20360 [Ipomoea batatas]GMD08572.1 hypothetical protein Iba_chr06cCG17970 [Ipomoea batatas]
MLYPRRQAGRPQQINNDRLGSGATGIDSLHPTLAGSSFSVTGKPPTRGVRQLRHQRKSRHRSHFDFLRRLHYTHFGSSSANFLWHVM